MVRARIVCPRKLHGNSASINRSTDITDEPPDVAFENKITTHDWLNYLSSTVDSKERQRLWYTGSVFTIIGAMIFIALIFINLEKITETEFNLNYTVLLGYMAFVLIWCIVMKRKMGVYISKHQQIINRILNDELRDPSAIRKEYLITYSRWK